MANGAHMARDFGTLRRLWLQLPLLLVLILPAAGAEAGGYGLDDWLKNDSGWKDFGVGTTTHMRKTSTMNIPGMPSGRKVVLEEKRTLSEKNDTKATITVARRTGKKDWESTSITERLVRAAAGTAEKILDEKQQPVKLILKIEGKDYPCVKYVGKRAFGDAKEVATLWVHASQGVLKYDGVLRYESDKASGQGSSVTWTVTRLRVERKVGSVTVVGRQVAVKGNGVTGTMVLSADVPGGTVEEVLTVTTGATTSTNKRQLVAFTKK